MKRTTIKQLYRSTDLKNGEKVRVAGWIRSIRANNNIGFVSINDGSFFDSLQVVIEKDKLDCYDKIASLNVGSAVYFEGNIVLTPDAKQPFELNADVAEIEGESTPDYPLQKKRHSNEYLRTIAHLRPRTNTFSAVFRVRSILAYAIHSFFNERGFVYVHTPIITTSDCEGAGEMFRVTSLDIENPPRNEDGTVDFSQDFFGKPTSLTVSGQLNVETHAMALGGVYTFGPTFRAEKSNTPRHVAEFWHVEPEVAFAELPDIIEIAESLIKHIINTVLTKCPEELRFFDRLFEKGLIEKLQNVANNDFAVMTYTEAIDILKKSGKDFQYPVEWGCDLQTEHERFISEEICKRPVFLTNYPKEIKSFYMKQNDDGKTVAATDLLVPGVGEIIGCSEREADLDKLLDAMQKRDMNLEDYEHYISLRRFGSVPHSGFGLGLERIIMYVTGVQNIRDVILYPRTVGSIY